MKESSPARSSCSPRKAGSHQARTNVSEGLNGNWQRRVPDAAVRTLDVMRYDVKIDTRKQQGFERGVKG